MKGYHEVLRIKLIAKGNTAEVQDYEDNKICKLFYSGYSEDAIRREYNNAQIIENENINIADLYLEKMGVQYDEIASFVDVISLCRVAERQYVFYEQAGYNKKDKTAFIQWIQISTISKKLSPEIFCLE